MFYKDDQAITLHHRQQRKFHVIKANTLSNGRHSVAQNLTVQMTPSCEGRPCSCTIPRPSWDDTKQRPRRVSPPRQAAKRHQTDTTCYCTMASRQKASNCCHITLLQSSMSPKHCLLHVLH